MTNARTRLTAARRTWRVSEISNDLFDSRRDALKSLLTSCKRFGIKPPQNASVHDLPRIANTLRGVQVVISMIEDYIDGVSEIGPYGPIAEDSIQTGDGSLVFLATSDETSKLIAKHLSKVGKIYGFSVITNGAVVGVNFK